MAESFSSESGLLGCKWNRVCRLYCGTVAHEQWSAWEAEQSSTWREIRAVGQVLQSLVDKLAGERIRWFTDDKNVVSILCYGSKKLLLQKESLRIFQMGLMHQIRMEPEWVPREEYQLADYWSKVIDYDDWMVHPAVFAQLDLMWGPHTVDRLPMSVIHSWRDLIRDFGRLIPRLLMLLLVIGKEKLTGGAHH